MNNKFYLLIALLYFQINALAQSPDKVTAMDQFMQANSDSTLVFEFKNDWFHFPEYYLLSKKGDTISCYTYKVPEEAFYYGPTPRKISEAMYKIQMKILSEPRGINQYFKSYTKNIGGRKDFWNEVSGLDPWSLKDDSVEGEGCPATAHTSAERVQPVVYDGAGISVTLITKSEIKILDFYAPGFYEENCPGRPGRIAINKMAKLFDEHFKIRSVRK